MTFGYLDSSRGVVSDYRHRRTWAMAPGEPLGSFAPLQPLRGQAGPDLRGLPASSYSDIKVGRRGGARGVSASALARASDPQGGRSPQATALRMPGEAQRTLRESSGALRLSRYSNRIWLTERRRSRTDRAWGCHAAPVLKTGWATGPVPLLRKRIPLIWAELIVRRRWALPAAAAAATRGTRVRRGLAGEPWVHPRYTGPVPLRR
jgi:hypothetical protein